MKMTKGIIGFEVCVLFVSFLFFSTAGATVYTYRGNSYTQCFGTYCNGGPYALSVTFDTTLTGNELANLPFQDITSTITSFSFTDGTGLTVNQNTLDAYGSFEISTNSSGDIVTWLIGGYANNAQVQMQTNWDTYYSFHPGADFSETTASFAGDYGFESGNPGTWVNTTSLPDVSGCIQITGMAAVGRKVTLRQTSETDQVTNTDSKGCYSFESANHDKPFNLIIQSNWSPMLEPTNLQVTSATKDSINVKWLYGATDAESFQLYRRKGASSAWSLLTTTSADTLTYADKTAVGNNLTNTYYYYVKACNTSVCSSATQQAAVPFAVSGLTATPSSGKIGLTWSNTSAIETGFQVYRKAGACAVQNPWKLIDQAPADASAYDDTTVTSGVPYSYKVRAYFKSPSKPYAYGYGLFSSCQSAAAP